MASRWVRVSHRARLIRRANRQEHDVPVRRGRIGTVHAARMRRSERMLLPARAASFR